jgi:hypothetical protein
VTAGIGPVQVDAAPELGVRNSQPEGIGRLVALEGLVCWNNLGRNVVFADSTLRPRAVFGTTLFPGQDEPSQYDLDVHAVLDVPGLGLVIVLNHFGTVRGFRRADLTGHGAVRLVEPVALWSFVADVERTVIAAGRLVASRPRSEGALGVLVSEPLAALPRDGRIPARLSATAFGEVTALAVLPSSAGPLVAMGGDGRVALARLDGDGLAPPQWEADVSFRVASIEWHADSIWAAGPARAGAVDDYDWEQLKGGGFTAFGLDGNVVAAGALPGDVAWGAGGSAVAAFGGCLLTAGRTGCLRLVDPRDPALDQSTAALADASLGIAHLAVAGRRAVWGFNRGGYRLHAHGPPGPSRA